LFTGDPPYNRNKHWLSERLEEDLPSQSPPKKQAGVAILISDEVNFKPTLVKIDTEGHSILKKGQYIKRK
jgi:hypothetical protein